MKPKAKLQSRKYHTNKISKEDENWCPAANIKKQKNSHNLGIKCLLILTLLFNLSRGRQPEVFYRMKRHLNESLN